MSARPLVPAFFLLALFAGCTASLDLDELDSTPSGTPNGGGSGGVAGRSPVGGAGGQGGAPNGGGGGWAGDGGRAGAAGQGGSAAGSSGSAGGGAGGTSGGGNASGGAAGAGGGGVAGKAGTAGASGGGTAGASGGGAAGSSSLPTCPVQATALHTLPTTTSVIRDLHTNGSLLVFVTSDAPTKFFRRSATLEPETVGSYDIPHGAGHQVQAARLGPSTMVFFGESWVYLSKDHVGGEFCTDGGPPQSTSLPVCNTNERRFDFDGTWVAMSGCGYQVVAPVDSSSNPKCDFASFAKVSEPGKIGSAGMTFGISLRQRLYTVDEEGGVFKVREKGFPTTPQPSTVASPTAFASDQEIGRIEGGHPSGALYAGGYVYTSVQDDKTYLWDIRRYKVGSIDDVTVLHRDITSLTAFAVVDNRVIWARKGGAQGAGATIWRGNTPTTAPPDLVACAPAAPTNLQVTPSFVFFADPSATEGKGPSVRGAALPP